MDAFDFYSSQSSYTEPKEFSYLYESLPDSIEDLTEIIRNLLVHSHVVKEVYGLDLNKDRLLEPNTRHVWKILKRILELQDKPLVNSREPEFRFVALCRDYAALLTSILRYRNMPARVRCGFANYFREGYLTDHWLCEYWNKEKRRWVLVDTEINDRIRKRYNIKDSLNSLDITHSEFITSAEAWTLYRQGKINPEKVGVPSINVLGDWFIRGNLLRDLAALNKVELLPWDYTRFSAKPDVKIEELPKEQIEELDNLARAISNIDNNFTEVIALYNKTPYFQAKGEIISHTGFGPIKTSL